jgi:hypothetical protein
MWDATTYLKEARDAHGRWVSGAAALGSAIDTLQKSGALNSSEAKEVTAAVERHSDMGRGLPTSADKDPGKTLDYLSATLKHDALTYRHQNPPDKSQAKALEHTASIIDKARANVNAADSPYRLTPDAQPLDGPTGPMRIKGYVKEAVTRLKRGDVVRVSTKNGNVIERTVERAAPNNDKTKTVVRWQTPVDGEKNSTSFEHSVKLSTVAYDGSHLGNGLTPLTDEQKALDKPPTLQEIADAHKAEGIASGALNPDGTHKLLVGVKKLKGDKKLTVKQVDKAVEQVAHGLVDYYGGDKSHVPISGDQITQEYLAANDVEARYHHPGEKVPGLLYGKKISDNLQDPEYGVMGLRQIAHEAAHSLSGVKPGPLPGISQTIEEGSAEILSLAWWAQHGQQMDHRDATRVRTKGGGKWTDNPLDTLAHTTVYRPYVEETMRRAASKVGWNRDAIVAEVQKVMAGDHGARLKFRDETNPNFALPSNLPDMPRSVAREDEKDNAVALVRWLVSPESNSAPQVKPQTPKPDSAAITMFDKPQVKPVDSLKRGNIVEVNTSKGKLTRTLNRSPKKSTNGKLVLEFADDKSADGHKKNLSYELGAKVHVVGQDDSYKVKVVSKANAPTEVQAMPEPKVVKTAAEVAKDAEPKVVQKAIDFDPRKYKVSSFLPGVSTQEDMRIALRLAMATKLKKRGDIFTLPGGVRIVTGGPNNMATGGKSNPSLFRVHGPNGHVDVYGLDNAATTALRFSANSTHPESLGGATAHGDYQEPYLSPEQTKAVSALTGNDKLVGYDPSAQPVIASVGSSGNVKPGTERVVQSDGTLEKMPYGQGYEGAHDVPTDEPKVVKTAAEVAKAAEPTVVQKANEPKVVKTSPVGAPNVKFAVKRNAVTVKQKVKKIPTTAENLKPGDVIVTPGVIIRRNGAWIRQDDSVYSQSTKHNIRQRIIAVSKDADGKVHVDLDPAFESDKDYVHESNDDMYRKLTPAEKSSQGYFSSKKYTLLNTDSLTFNPDATMNVQRLVDLPKSGGGRVKVDQQPTAADMRDVLQDALDNDGNLESLNPEQRNMLAGYSVGHTQQLLYDMAVGKRNGVTTGNVKTNRDYLDEMKGSGEADQIASDAADATPYKIDGDSLPYSFAERKTGLTIPADTDKATLRKYAMALSMSNASDIYAVAHNGSGPRTASFHDFVAQLKNEDIPDYMKAEHTEDGSPSVADHAVKNMLDRRALAAAEKALEMTLQRIKDRRAEEHTTDRAMYLPTWDEMQMEPQSWDTVGAGVTQQAVPHEATLGQIDNGASRITAVTDALKPTDGQKSMGMQSASMSFGRVLMGGIKPEDREPFLKALSEYTPSVEKNSNGDPKLLDIVEDYLAPSPTTGSVFQTAGMMRTLTHDDYQTAYKAWQTWTPPPAKTIATRDFTPSLHTAGLVDDGVLYHRQERAPSALNEDKLRRALSDSVKPFQAIDSNPDYTAKNLTNFLNGSVGDVQAADMSDEDKLAHVDKNIDEWIAPGDPQQAEALHGAVAQVRQRLANAPKTAQTVTTAHVGEGKANDAMLKIMEANQAIGGKDSKGKSLDGKWWHGRPGDQLTIQEGGRLPTEDEVNERVRNARISGGAYSASSTFMPPTLYHQPAGYQADQFAGPSMHIGSISNVLAFDQSNPANQPSVADMREALDQYDKLIPQSYSGEGNHKLAKAYSARMHATLDRAEHERIDDGTLKSIEYVPWKQNEGTRVARSDRGRLTVNGYTPQEAAEKLKALGIVGDLEPQTPAQQIFRSDRRTGNVMPLHSAYVRGDAQPPSTDRLTVHGMTDKGASVSTKFEQIIRTGGILPISERFKRGIYAQGSSVAGDVGSGIDNVAFQFHGGGGICGSNSPLKILVKPDVMMRRDVALSNKDFGGGEDRYSRYKKYRDWIETQAGLEVGKDGKTSLYDPLDPAARQVHLDNVRDAFASGYGGAPMAADSAYDKSAEFNVAGGIHPNDIAAIYVAGNAERDRVQQVLDAAYDQGLIDHKPPLLDDRTFDHMSTGKIALPDDSGHMDKPEDAPAEKRVDTALAEMLSDTGQGTTFENYALALQSAVETQQKMPEEMIVNTLLQMAVNHGKLQEANNFIDALDNLVKNPSSPEAKLTHILASVDDADDKKSISAAFDAAKAGTMDQALQSLVLEDAFNKGYGQQMELALEAAHPGITSSGVTS